MLPGTHVEVRSRFDRRWARGFEVDAVVTPAAGSPEQYQVRRRSDGCGTPVAVRRRGGPRGASRPIDVVGLSSGSSRSRCTSSSTGTACNVIVRIVPRAASEIAALARVASSGASMMFRKSHWPMRAYWATT